jgi:sugar/nucleoside kinase (ribokinase family)
MTSLMAAPAGLDPAFLKVTDVLVVNEHEASLLTGLPVATKYAIFGWGL